MFFPESGPGLQRRRLLQAFGAAALAATPALAALPVLAQSGKSTATPSGKPLVIAQLADMSAEQQDVSRDFLAGSRAAWQDINLRGGLQGRPVQHLTVELDGSTEAIKGAWQPLRENGACIALSGTTGHRMATLVSDLLRQEGASLPHVAPWLQNSGADVDSRTFPIFAGRQEQISHAIRSLSLMGVPEIGAVYATELDHSLYRGDVERTAAAMKLPLRSLRLGPADVAPNALPTIVLFVGGTPELVRFCQGFARQASSRQQFIVALADVNLATLAQAGMPRNTPVIVTQPVPVITASSPLVRAYRETLARLFDEAPTPQSLAGFIAARYTYTVLSSVEAPLTRQLALAAFARRSDVDLNGFHVSYDARRRGSGYVTQSMLTMDGRLLG
ncbi:ABC transporter substrate-binding protein [Variovorax sp. VNK109]|uniref:ABC transporter substrate-binding protein n=1 Tax=Variovorax sp. VNK109 TaxID=3400919 RepID=UPI003C0759D9